MAALTGKVIENIQDLKLNYDGAETVAKSVVKGSKSKEFTKLVSILTSQLALLYDLEEHVNPINDEGGSEAFLFEVSGFLQEYGCPYNSLKSGDLKDRLSSKENCLTLLFFLTSELQAARVHFAANSATNIPGKANIHKDSDLDSGNKTYQELDLIRQALQMAPPPSHVSNQMYFNCVEKKLDGIIKQIPEETLSKPIISKQLGPAHWEKISAINDVLVREYSTRRSMLLKRLDVTIASFGWSDRAKANFEEIAKVYQHKRHRLSSESTITIAHLLAAREDLSQMSKTSSGDTRHACAINRVVMGKVPDRGGRTDEIDAPPPEMPSWQKRENDGGRGGGGRGNNRGGRGGRDFHNSSRGGYSNDRPNSGRGDNHNNRPDSGRGGYNNRPDGGRGGNNNGPDSGRGGYNNNNRGQSRWSRGRGGYQAGNGAFEQTFGQGGQQSGRGGFAAGRQNFSSS